MPLPDQQFSILRQSSDWRVWRGVDKMSRERFTVKQVNPDARYPESLIQQLYHEYEFYTQLSHPGLLSVRRYEEQGPAILFEDTQGTLRQLLDQEGALPLDLVANVLMECGEALEYLHGQRFGHGLLNTQTILVAPNGRIKFGDFTGYPFHEQTPPSLADHSPRYVAPEQLNNGLGLCSPSSDLYCLGYVALEMLTAGNFEQLFGIDQRAQGGQQNWLGWHCNLNKELPDLRERLSTQEVLIDLINGLVQKRIEQRSFKTAGDLIRTLKNYGLTSQRTLPPLRGPEDDDDVLTRRRKRYKHNICLVPRKDNSKKATYFSHTRGVVIGRKETCDLVVEHNTVSQRHALLACHGNGTWWLYDLKSTSGTYVNKVRQTDPIRVLDGDKIHFGRAEGYRVELPDPEEKPDDAPIRRVGPVRLLQLVHSGGNGDLYKGQLYRGGRTLLVGVRLFPLPFTYDADQLRRFLRGVRAAQFKHGNIVRLYRAGRLRKQQQWYVVMEWLSGGSLRDRLRKRPNTPLPIRDVLNMARDLLTGLMAIEEEEVLHRNITPSCVLFNSEGKAKLGDFLLMREEELEEAQKITRAGVLPGEKVYQPPELLFDPGRVCAASDLYSLGAVLYEAVTGHPPFSFDMELPDLLRAVKETPPIAPRDLNEDVPPGLDELIRRALNKSPDRRWQAAAEMERALYDVMRDYA